MLLFNVTPIPYGSNNSHSIGPFTGTISPKLKMTWRPVSHCPFGHSGNVSNYRNKDEILEFTFNNGHIFDLSLEDIGAKLPKQFDSYTCTSNTRIL